MCKGSKLLLESDKLFCNICGEEIKKKANYYADGGNKVNLCKSCYTKFGEEIKVGDEKYHKANLKNIKNEDVVEEGWVLCEFCNKWYHIICALFNNRDSLYCCPKCLLRLYDEIKISSPIDTTSPLDASKLPTCRLSDVLEKAIRKRVLELRQNRKELIYPKYLSVIIF